MKPVMLKFSGLQSYREEQVIDFGLLGAVGIFGVFGPTGAGKSTILDGITLALFGKVFRAKSGTRGIMNQYEDRLAVSFEFSLGNEKFLAERLYQRDRHDPDSVKIKNARLVQTSTGSVLADKSSDLDTRITELLGMSYEDFSRAVILPQGKFDQFLKLTGGERARMLENILRLERYGEQLSKKAVDLENDLKNRLETNNGLLAQLGDASAEVIAQAEADLEKQVRVVAEQDKLRKQAENEFRELDKTAGLHNELESMLKEKQKLEAERPVLEKLRKRLEKSLRAEPLRRLLEQEDELVEKTAGARTVLNRLELKLAEVTGKEEEFLIRLRSAEEKEAEINVLKEQELPRAALAVAYERQVCQLEAELEKIRKDIEDKTHQMEQVSAEGRKKGDLLEKVRRENNIHWDKRKALLRVLGCRGAVEKCLAALSELEAAEKQDNEVKNILAGKEKVLNAQGDKLLKVLKENLEVPQGKPDEKDFAELMDKAAVVVRQASEEKRLQDEDLEKVIAGNMAGELAKRLRAGEPCPVCGSRNHPRPVPETTDDDRGPQEARAKAAEAGTRLEQILEWHREAIIAYNSYQNVLTDIRAEYLPNWQKKARALAAAVTDFTAACTLLSDALSQTAPITVSQAVPETACLYRLTGDPNRDREKVREVREALEEAENTVKTLEGRIRETDGRIKGVETELAELRARYRELGAEKTGLENSWNSGSKSLIEQKTRIAEITGGKKAVDYEKDIRDQIALFQAELNNARKTWESLQKRKQEISRELAVAAAGISTLNESLEGVRRELQDQVVKEGYADTAGLRESLMEPDERSRIQKRLNEYDKLLDHLETGIRGLWEKIGAAEFDFGKLEQARENLNKESAAYKEAVGAEGALRNQLAVLREKHDLWNKLREERVYLLRRRELAGKLVSLLKGRKYVQFLAEEHLRDMAAEASIRLGTLTGQRYSLELDESGNFVMRDDYSGSQRRPVNTLSGGETFLTSLALALALSSKIQLKGQYPLGFFFLDEGFGTLDQEKLEVVMGTLERLHDGNRMVGVITHVPELRNRLPRCLEVIPAMQDGTGSRVEIKAV